MRELSTDFSKSAQYQFSRKSILWEPNSLRKRWAEEVADRHEASSRFPRLVGEHNKQ
jgi:hypothetical protein